MCNAISTWSLTGVDKITDYGNPISTSRLDQNLRFRPQKLHYYQSSCEYLAIKVSGGLLVPCDVDC